MTASFRRATKLPREVLGDLHRQVLQSHSIPHGSWLRRRLAAAFDAAELTLTRGYSDIKLSGMGAIGHVIIRAVIQQRERREKNLTDQNCMTLPML